MKCNFPNFNVDSFQVTDKQKNTKTIVRGNIRGFYHGEFLKTILLS